MLTAMLVMTMPLSGSHPPQAVWLQDIVSAALVRLAQMRWHRSQPSSHNTVL
jgi:hypothetical protein